jgi:hypothetical protein
MIKINKAGNNKMKKLNITWDGISDTTGYFFSFAKSLSAALKNSPYSEFAEDIIATSGFAFRMWVDRGLCPSATSIWEFRKQKTWVENGGLACDYVERLWGQDNIEEERRKAAVEIIKQSVDNGIAAVSWDISGCEWGLVTGYDDAIQKFFTLQINGSQSEIAYETLGKIKIPLLSVLTVTGKTDKSTEQIIGDTIKLAASHLNGDEWCENPKGLSAYPALISSLKEKYKPDLSWNLEYYLGTYAALKYYAWKFFDKYEMAELAECYKAIHRSWQTAFEVKKSLDAADSEVMGKIISDIETAYECEKQAFEIMNK